MKDDNSGKSFIEGECINFSHVISHVTFTSCLQSGDYYGTTPCCIVGTFT
jgi:hypothetical protein